MNNEESLREMGIRLRRRRKEQQLSQRQLASLCHVSVNHISSIETARERPSLDLLLSLCDILKTTPDYLLLGVVHPQDNIGYNLIDKLRLCSTEDIQLVSDFIELLIHRNSTRWNEEHYI